MAAADTYYYPLYNLPAHFAHGSMVQAFVRNMTALQVDGALDEADDRLFLGRLPKNVKILGWRLYLGDFDDGSTDAAHDLEIGDGTTTKTLVSATTIGQAGGIVDELDTASVPTNIGFVTDTDGYDVWIETDTAPGSAQDGAICVVIYYTGLLNPGEEN